MYCKHLINCTRNTVITQKGEQHEKIKKYDPANATTTINNITVDINPAYGTTTTIKMDSNPAYITAIH